MKYEEKSQKRENLQEYCALKCHAKRIKRSIDIFLLGEPLGSTFSRS
ncbi:unnamed protein product [Haemonchus placei]|uniref:Transposase n=1 Tax=Haemonchus placei TaxID=6290 RepID=A0A0N4W897_HAEPC|nr:unnamed protein product [Haemonchus placei]